MVSQVRNKFVNRRRLSQEPTNHQPLSSTKAAAERGTTTNILMTNPTNLLTQTHSKKAVYTSCEALVGFSA